MIPKRIFFFWSNDKMSWLRYMTLLSFKKLNPDWTVQLYIAPFNFNKEKTWNCNVNQDFFNYKGYDNYIDKLHDIGIEVLSWELHHPNEPDDKWKNIGSSHKSNFFKWQQLGEEGGIYADMDILFIKSFDNFYNNLTTHNFTTALCYTKYLSIGLLASVPNNKFFQDIFLHAFKSYTPNSYQCVGVENIYDFLSQGKCWKNKTHEINWSWISTNNINDIIGSKYKEQKIYNIPMNLVYPFKFNEMGQVFQRPPQETLYKIKENTTGIHWYAGDPIAQDYNNKMNLNTYNGYDNIISHFLRKLL